MVIFNSMVIFNFKLRWMLIFISFENELVSLVQNIRFRKTRNHFLKKIQKDIWSIKSSDKTIFFADKTTNLYRLTKAEYDHMINNAITSKYKKASSNR